MTRTYDRPIRTAKPPALSSSFSSVAFDAEALRSGPCTVTPCRRASPTRVCGE
jgi:hypothetical protein